MRGSGMREYCPGVAAHAGVDVNTDGWQSVIEMIMEQAAAMTAMSQ